MITQQFFAKYANTPLKDRDGLDKIYFRLNDLQKMMRPFCIETDNLLREAEELFEKLKTKE